MWESHPTGHRRLGRGEKRAKQRSTGAILLPENLHYMVDK